MKYIVKVIASAEVTAFVSVDAETEKEAMQKAEERGGIRWKLNSDSIGTTFAVGVE